MSKKYYPSYYKNFKCIADKCEDTCCSAWVITIDKKTLQKYKKMQGNFADKIISYIYENDENESCFKLQNGKCPFLNKNGLCDIHIYYGEEYTSEICREHPRFTEIYDGFTEVSLSFSCPQAARVITSFDEMTAVYPKPTYNGSDELLNMLICSRDIILISDKKCIDLLDLILKIAVLDTKKYFDLDFREYNTFYSDILKNFLNILFFDCEILSSKWKNMLKKAIDSHIDENKIFDFIVQNENTATRILKYFVYRYYLKAVNDEYIISKAFFVIYSFFCCVFLSISNSETLFETTRLYSKEIEHNTENTDFLVNFMNDFEEQFYE